MLDKYNKSPLAMTVRVNGKAIKIICHTILPIGRTKGKWDYRVYNNVIIGGERFKGENTQINQVPDEENDEINLEDERRRKALQFVDMSNVYPPKGMKPGKEFDDWWKSEKNKQVEYIITEFGEELDDF